MKALFYLAIIYVLFLFIFSIIALIIKIKINKNLLTFLFWSLIISFSIIAFCTFPSEGTDLSRYYIELDNMRRLGIEYVLNDSLYKETILTNLLFYSVSLLKFNNFLPAISTFVTFLVFFSILKNEIKILNSKSQTIIIYLLSFFAIAVLRAQLTGVRQHLANSLILFAIYLDLIKDRKIESILFYLFAVMIHVGIFPILIIRLIYMIFKEHKFGKLLILSFPIATPLFKKIATILGGSFAYAYDKLIGYSDIEYPDMRFFIARIMFYVVILIMYGLIKSQKNINENVNDSFKKYLELYSYILIFTPCALVVPHLGDRMIGFSFYMAFPIFTFFFDYYQNKYKLLFKLIIVFFITGLLLYQLVDALVSWRFYFVI